MLINDVNNFFSVGLSRYINNEIYECIEKELNNNIWRKGLGVDLCFIAIETSIDFFFALTLVRKNTKRVILFIMDRPEDGFLIPRWICKHFTVIYRNDSLMTIRRKIIDQIRNWGSIGYFDKIENAVYECNRSSLSECEIQVLELIARGVSINGIANILGRSVKTIYSQRYSIMRKLRLKNSHELILFIIKHQRVLMLS